MFVKEGLVFNHGPGLIFIFVFCFCTKKNVWKGCECLEVQKKEQKWNAYLVAGLEKQISKNGTSFSYFMAWCVLKKNKRNQIKSNIKLHDIIFFGIVPNCTVSLWIRLCWIKSCRITLNHNRRESYITLESCFICIFNVLDPRQCIKMRIKSASVKEKHVAVIYQYHTRRLYLLCTCGCPPGPALRSEWWSWPQLLCYTVSRTSAGPS